MPIWLPEKLCFKDDFNGDWTPFFSHVYSIFTKDFIDNKPLYEGKRLGLKRYPEHDNKPSTFWHIISEGSIEEDRLPSIDRCERIGWSAPIINNSHDNEKLKIWIETVRGENRIHIWLESRSYIVVLNQRKDYLLLWTAFYIEREHQQKKYEKRWRDHKLG